MKEYKVCVVTGTRAEYGLLKPVLQKIRDHKHLDLRLVVTGSHLSKAFGYTINEILNDGFQVDCQIPCVSQWDNEFGMVESVSVIIKAFGEYLKANSVDIVVVLGDRYEIFGCASAAAIMKVPIVHLYGGDTTEGAIDEFIRHSISKMSYLHFVSNEESRHRVIQLGENPNRIYDVGALGIENILKMNYMSKEELEASIEFDLSEPYGMVTFHPVTLENSSAKLQMLNLLEAINRISNMRFIFTKANSDANGREINALIDDFVKDRKNCIAFESLGMLRYLSALKYAKIVIGNSSSGIYEAPVFGIPTINIGDRQKGRLQPNTVFNCEADNEQIVNAINMGIEAQVKSKMEENPYYKSNTSQMMVEKIYETLKNGNIDLKKKFYNLENGNL